MKTNLILGPPGTGKTTTLLKILEKVFEEGIKPHEIAFLTFTKKAIREALTRMKDKFEITRDELPYFRTIHSICFREGGYSRGEMMGPDQLKDLTKLTGFGWSQSWDIEGPSSVGQAVMAMIELASAKQVSVKEIWEGSLNEFDLDWFKVKYLLDTYKEYKEEHGFIDFADMLEEYQKHGDPLPVKVGIIDEAQDLSTLQWSVVKKFFSNGTRKLFIAGDDDQAIYKWSGADLRIFLNLKGDSHKILNKSYRLSREVLKLSKKISEKINDRYVKEFSPRDVQGRVEKIEFHHLDNILNQNLNQSWYFLGRNKFLLQRFKDLLRTNGIPFTIKNKSSIDPEHSKAIYGWQKLVTGKSPFVSREVGESIWRNIRGFKFPKKGRYALKDFQEEGIATDSWFNILNNIPVYDREYYRSVLRNKFNLLDVPRFHINTIHGVKGGEADNVVLLTDYSAKTARGFEFDPDSEHRVFYVGATRARENLYIVYPQTEYFYEV